MQKAKNLVSQMTVDEKISMLTAVNHVPLATIPAVERLGIRNTVVTDGPHGVRMEGDREANCTALPCIAALGATWNKRLAYLMGQTIAKDCICHGFDMVLGPGVNIKRTDLCGRNFEYFSEDPVLSGEMAAQYINGVQDLGIGACIKHFAVNNQETDRLFVNAEIDERTMRELYLKAFEIAIEKSNPASVMCAYNKVNGVLCSENRQLLTEILKKEWGFQGFVMSDWGCTYDNVRSLNAGLDLQMPCRPWLYDIVREAYDKGIVTDATLDEAVERIVDFVVNCNPKELTYNRQEQHDAAVKIAEESIVLLKNDNNLLPITKEKYRKIVVVGEYADKPVISGFGSSNVFPGMDWIDSPLACLKKNMGEDVEITYIPLYPTDRYFDEAHFNLLSQLNGIENADLVIMFAGRQQSVETEGIDRVTSHIDPYYEFFIKKICQKNKNFVMVLQAGGAVLPLTWQNKVSAIVQMWLGGEGAGSAIANVLCGKVNPSGKLEETFPYRSRTDLDYPGDGLKVRYDEKLAVGYRYYDQHPEEIWFPFGHGLSYTTFRYDELTVTPTEQGFHAAVTVTNTGAVAGAEVIQLYVHDNISIMTKPEKELIAFEKVFLEPGESKTVFFDITEKQLAYYNISLHEWVCEPGSYAILVGASSRDIRLTGEYRCEKEPPYTMNYLAEQLMA